MNRWLTRWELVILPLLLFTTYEFVIGLAAGPAAVVQSAGHELAWCLFTLDLWALAVVSSGGDLRQGGRGRLEGTEGAEEARFYQATAAVTALAVHVLLFLGLASWAGYVGPGTDVPRVAGGVGRGILSASSWFLCWRFFVSPPKRADRNEEVV